MDKNSFPVWGSAPVVSEQIYKFPIEMEAVSAPSPRKDNKINIPSTGARFLTVKEFGKPRKFQIGKLISSECQLFTGYKISSGQGKKNKRKYDFVIPIN